VTVEQEHVVVAAAIDLEREFTELVATEDCALASADVADRLPAVGAADSQTFSQPVK
jgi:hypothetical protein